MNLESHAQMGQKLFVAEMDNIKREERIKAQKKEEEDYKRSEIYQLRNKLETVEMEKRDLERQKSLMGSYNLIMSPVYYGTSIGSGTYSIGGISGGATVTGW